MNKPLLAFALACLGIIGECADGFRAPPGDPSERVPGCLWIEAESFADYGAWPLDTHDPLGIENPVGDGYWKHHPAVPIYTIPYRCLCSTNGNAGPAELAVDVYSADGSGEGPVAADMVASARALVPPGRERFVAVTLDEPVALTRPYLWVVCHRAKGLSWVRRPASPAFRCTRAYGQVGSWKVLANDGYSLVTVPGLTAPFDTRPEYVIDGVARPVGDCSHGWASELKVTVSAGGCVRR